MTSIKFSINGKNYEVSSSVEGNTSLNSYIRNVADLRGTKAMCHEGGCGACIVSVRNKHPVTGEMEIFSVNSCLVSILSCHGWAITTVEGIGNKKDGYHLIQDRLATFNGTQCGYCSPGWVMNMYSVYENRKEHLTMKEVENSFAGNICRCTGYRPILDAFKSLSKDASSQLLRQVVDIEDLSNVKLCNKKKQISYQENKREDAMTEDGFCLVDANKCSDIFYECDKKMLKLSASGVHWYKVYSLKDLFDVFDQHGTDSYTLVAGNTGQGVYRRHILPNISIDITAITDLRKHNVDGNLTLGSGMTLAEMMNLFQDISKKDINFEYTQKMFDHMDLVAHIPVRNIGTIGGNLSLKHQHNEFQSDLFLIFETVNATLSIAEKHDKFINVSLPEYLKLDMKGKIIVSINLPPLSMDYKYQSYKIMPRAQNAHAHVNAGFLFKFNSYKDSIEKVNIVYGGINPKFIHAEKTERFLMGKNIFNDQVLKEALKQLSEELDPDEAPPEPSPKYRRQLAVNLFYKCILHICPPNLVSSRNKSGGFLLDRPVSSGKQNFDTNKENWPINQPILKIEAMNQCSGEAKYVNDVFSMPNELYAAFALSTVAKGEISDIKTDELLMKKGVIAIYTAKDIPGTNDFIAAKLPPFYTDAEEILCSGKIKHHGQPVALVVAETEKLAKIAAEELKITYKNVPSTPPVISVREAMKDKSRVVPGGKHPAKGKGQNIKNVISGSFDIFGQYHYTMETLSCVCVPIEDGIDVFPSSQWMDNVQIAIANMLKVPENSVNINVRRLGGAYGLKISRAGQVATACALAAHKLQRPVRLVLPLETNMSAIGKRLPCSADYEVSVDDQGVIQYLDCTFYEDNGCSNNETMADLTMAAMPNCYDGKYYNINANSVVTDTPGNTWCRAPATTEAIAMIENIMEHIAVETEKDPVDVRIANLDPSDKNVNELIDQVKKSSEYEARANSVKTYNEANKWKKRGISLTPLKYAVEYFGTWYAMISVYQGDGTIAITHGGIEMGQGLNTKVAQVCAHTLGVPLDMVSVKPSNSLTAPNSTISGGSISSESACFATLRAAEILVARLAPVKSSMDNPTWKELIAMAYLSGVDLCAHYYHTPLDGVPNYEVYGCTVIEIEIDLLTGNHQILRVDLLEDTGESISPLIDVGQVEGAYVMGLGYWTSENLVYDPKTGALLTNRTWTYKPPGVKDIPVDFRVSFRRNAPNNLLVLRSKATGEPPLNMTFGIINAIRQAIGSFKKEDGTPSNKWFNINLPATAENIVLAADIQLTQMTL